MKNTEMIEQSIKAFEFLNTLVDILKSLELYEFINHQKKMEVVESDIYIGEDDLRSELALNITDEDLFVRLKSLSRIDLEALCSIYSLSKMCRNKLLNALKENDYPSFCQVNSKEDVFFIYKVVIKSFDYYKEIISNSSRNFTIIIDAYKKLDESKSIVGQFYPVANSLYADSSSVNIILSDDSIDTKIRNMGNQLKLLPKLLKDSSSDKENEEYLMALLEEYSQELSENIFDMIQGFPTQYVNRFFNKMSESAYAFELQEIYNGYKQKNPGAVNIVICPDNYKAPRIFNLPESFDTLRQTGIEKVKYDFRLDLNRKSIEYLYKELIDRYVFDIPIEQFAYILTGKREKVKRDGHPLIKWLGTMQDLSCFIGLLCQKRKGKDTYGIWSITKRVFVIEGITIDNKSISSEFSKIKKEHKSYIYFKELIEQTVG
ncbi:hypothetical protein NXW18_23585 [Bacteroides thetaiotaomicron]|uniref:hypothetical protein n=1 Tax=Bacteroides thetaiotaomicron TaxID=818 RepID=UPI0021662CA8|nr:hypothetical protein [Bacteroides thetaiotaomicron]MCS2716323.1 hypothetical protein [Bacteroides thetaiotaomicron]MCS2876684.1 hypothetical protein [Bacteroides thetaiotaomicron]